MQMEIVVEDGHVVGARSWVDGFRPLPRRIIRRLVDEEEALRHAEWIAATASHEAAVRFIQMWWEKGGIIELH